MIDDLDEKLIGSIPYNNKNMLFDTKYFLKWFKDNREKMREINNPKEEVLDFFSFPCFSEQVM